MASERPPNTQWNDNEIFAFLDHLISEKAKVTGGGFKNNVFNQAARVITQFTTHGPTKTGGHCKGKWQYLKNIHSTINRYCNRSGCHWDNESSANIVGGVAETQWNQFLESNSNKAMKLFRNSRWKFFPKMEEILPNGSGAVGAAAYNLASLATQSPAVVTSATLLVLRWAAMLWVLLFVCPLLLTTYPVSPAHADGFGWDRVMSALPSTNIGIVSGSSMNMPPPPSSVSASSTRKCLHSDMLFSGNITQSSMSHVDSASSEKKPKLSAHGGSTMSRVASQCNSKAAMEVAGNTAAFMNLQSAINHLTDSLSKSMTNTDESWVADERSQALAIMQDNEEITPEDKVILMIVFGRSPSTCATYVSSRPENRLPYLRSVIHQALRGDFGAL
ncbi:hypothetical protein DFJ58DRAFT_727477 [Suillus subalutaceus]|uniref:uncharacterized protein n=1 Tax=Suillus subalutaceus TaxID=48586 RepID=UPI001B8642FB|nr:uncharacterized protein DFJ58DRAFT_727477 [Suillus subalutaceus]KAG1855662.1 hypothetical protein DFJ58DRAFT_727477 [Suillus subalutaceus]